MSAAVVNASGCADSKETALERLVYLVYLDDSASENRAFQVIGAVILNDSNFEIFEDFLAMTIDELVPEELRKDFEFHAADIFHRTKPFDCLDQDRAMKILHEVADAVKALEVPIIYGAVDCTRLNKSLYASANATEIAFRICAQGVEAWFSQQVKSKQLGVFIADETNKGTKHAIQNAFRTYRKRRKSLMYDSRGRLEHIHDDMYFGDSSYSIGIQLADICTYLVMRHLCGKEDTEYLYKIIEEQIAYGVVEPSVELP